MALGFGDARGGPIIQPRPPGTGGGAGLPVTRTGGAFNYIGGGAGYGPAVQLARMRYAARRPMIPGETLPGTEPGVPRKPIKPEEPYWINPYRNYPGFTPLQISPEAMTGRVGRRYIPGGEHYLPPEEMQQLSDAAIGSRGFRLAQYGGGGQGAGMGALDTGDILRRLLLSRGYLY